MAADITSMIGRHRQSMLLAADAVIRLDHQFGRDRVRRILYEHLQSVTVWTEFPTALALGAGLLLGTPALLAVVALGAAGVCVAVVPLILLAVLLIWISIQRRTVIRFVWAGQQFDFSGIVRKATVELFIKRLNEAVVHARRAAEKANAERRASNEVILEEIREEFREQPPPLPG